jgi:hypothetical protein
MLSGKSTVAVSEPIENAQCLSQTNDVNVAAFVLQSNGRQAGEERLLYAISMVQQRLNERGEHNTCFRLVKP